MMGGNEQHIVFRGEKICILEHPEDRGEADPSDECHRHALVSREFPSTKQRLQEHHASEHAQRVNGGVLRGVACISRRTSILDDGVPDDGFERLGPHRVERQDQPCNHGEGEPNGGPYHCFFSRCVDVIGKRRGEIRLLGCVMVQPVHLSAIHAKRRLPIGFPTITLLLATDER